MSEFPKLGINAKILALEVEELLVSASQSEEDMGAVNWDDIGVTDIEYRISMLHPEGGPVCVVILEEAAPGCRLQTWLNDQLKGDPRFPSTYVECEW